MFDAAWRSEADGSPLHVGARDSDLARAQGAAEIVFSGGSGVTRLAHLFQSTPCRVAFPRPAPGDLPLAVVLTTTGGLTGGDRVRLSMAVKAGAAAMVTTQAAEKIYRSLDADTDIAVQVAVEDHCWLEWLPQETILFDGARLRRRTRIDVAGQGRVLAGEMLVLGRTAHGERFTRGLAHDAWRVYREGRLVWADALRLDNDIARVIAGSAGFDGARALATIVYVGADAAERLDAARDLQDTLLRDDALLRGGATCMGDLLVARFLGADAFMVRRAFGRFWKEFRALAAELPQNLPRLWDT